MSIKSQFLVGVVNEPAGPNTQVTFGSSTTLSSIFSCEGVQPASLYLPAGWSSGTISFQVSKTPDGTFLPMTDTTGAAYSVTAAASTFIPLDPVLFKDVLFLQLVSSVNQTDQVVDLGLMPLWQGIHN